MRLKCLNLMLQALSSAGMHHPKADVDRLYVWHSDQWGTRIVEPCKRLEDYNSFSRYPPWCCCWKGSSAGFLSSVVSFQRKGCQSKSLLSLASKFNSLQHTVLVTSPTVEAKRISTVTKKSMQGVLLGKWKNKALHGRYFDRLNKSFVDKRISLNWLRN